MKTTLNRQSDRDIIFPKNMKVGQMGIIEDFPTNPVNGHIVLRIYDEIVSLNTPEYTWCADACSLAIRLLSPGESVTLEQE